MNPPKSQPPGPLPGIIPDTRPGPQGGKRDVNRRARTQALLDAATALFVERGVEDVRIDDITRAAGVAKGSFYRYFEDKQSLLRHVLAPVQQRAVRAFASCERRLRQAQDGTQLRGAYNRLGKELAAAIVAHPSVARIYLQERSAPAGGSRAPVAELETELIEGGTALTELAFEHGLLRRVHPRVSTLAVFGAAERLLQAFLSGTLQVAPGQAVQDLVTIVIDGMRGPDGAPTDPPHAADGRGK